MISLPRVSIITTVLNDRKHIEFAMQSVLGQNYSNIEYIIVDGGSTDGTLRVINRYKHRLAKFISEPDKNKYYGMNKGIRLATGDIVGILNSDDFYTSKKVIGEIVEIMEKKNADCCWGDLVYVSREDTDKTIRYWKSSEYKDGKFKRGWMPPHPTFFVRRGIYNKHGFFRLNFPNSGDYELMLRFLEKHKIKSCYIPKILVKMRAGGQSNKNIKSIIRANTGVYRAWKVNGLRMGFFTIFLKLLRKIPQCVRRP